MHKLCLKAFTVFCLLICIGCGGGSSDDRVSYVALGASDATGVGAIPPSDGYVFLIDNRLARNCKPVDLTNVSIPAAELPVVIEVQLPILSELSADLVTLWAGPNDLIAGESIENFTSNFREVVDQVLAESPATFFVATIPDLRRVPRFEEAPDPDVTLERIMAYNEAIRDIAGQSERVIVVELANLDVGPNLVSDIDGFHPNDEGHNLLANFFLDEIRPRFCE